MENNFLFFLLKNATSLPLLTPLTSKAHQVPFKLLSTFITHHHLSGIILKLLLVLESETEIFREVCQEGTEEIMESELAASPDSELAALVRLAFPRESSVRLKAQGAQASCEARN